MVKTDPKLPAFVTLKTAFLHESVVLPETFKTLARVYDLHMPMLPALCVTSQAFIDFLDSADSFAQYRALVHAPILTDTVARKKAVALVQNTRFGQNWFEQWTTLYHSYLQGKWVTLQTPDQPHLAREALPKQVRYLKGDSVIAQFIKKIWVLSLQSNLHSLPSIMIQAALPAHLSGRVDTVKTTQQQYLAFTVYKGESPQVHHSHYATPDHYTLDSTTLGIVSKQFGSRSAYLELDQKGMTKSAKVNREKEAKALISNQDLSLFATRVNQIRNSLFKPVSVEFVGDTKKLYITKVSTFMPEPPVNTPANPVENQSEPVKILAEVGRGVACSPGVVTGVLKIIKGPQDLSSLKSSDIICLPAASLQYVTYLSKCAGVISLTGGATSHLAILARESALPYVAGTGALPVATGTSIQLNGTLGTIHIVKSGTHSSSPDTVMAAKSGSGHLLTTGTKLYLNASLATQNLYQLAKEPVAGIGQLRGRFIVSRMQKHPKEFSTTDMHHFKQELHTTIFELSQLMGTRPVYYVPADLNTLDYHEIAKNPSHYEVDANPTIGFRGTIRLLQDPLLFPIELEVIARLRSEFSCQNIHLVAPFVRLPEEFARFKRTVLTALAGAKSGLRLFALIETPLAAFNLNAILRAGADGLIINFDHLIPLLMGVDPLAHDLQELVTPAHPEVLSILAPLIANAAAANVPIIITGQLLNNHLKLLPQLLQWGVTGIATETSLATALNTAIHHSEYNLITKPTSLGARS